ncbi:right-handed parallel beta-helix repeat-containing protein [Blastopirellula sp. JC732]|uniref:Right-handed parallel beta-helix repeat-containing protein n=1 Tax=Blastopirellula sediminis TaxID=2894196 RepID=A0A9X1MR18_9BACT|nr:right-handed parallel beta-helix repeat-containing protein [Blastopirellula sediminis]MCC9606669.1 right-handed parallel beta-helix repeat-containing protein [Blastopirellula sediminis]MCC9630034.1 right-handed parallel beta-helix repeat-containing protein [Blastopirellula sediminis]
MWSQLSSNSLRTLLCGFLCYFACSAALFAQQQNDDITPGMISGTSSFASPYSNGLWGEYFPRVSVQHRTEGAGYNYSFTDFRTWVPLYESYDAHALTYFDGAFLLANDRNVGMNAVVGQRFYSDDYGRTFGGFVGYDNRDTGIQTVGQVVAGFESLGKIDFRANGYFPTDTDPVSTGLTYSDPTYVGYNIQLLQTTDFQTAMKGFDAEFGGALPYVGDYVRAYLGMYNFQGEDSPQAWGWKTRFESHVTDRMRLYLTVSDDQVFDTNVVFGAAFFFPGSSARRVPRYDSFVNKMDEPLVRNEAVVVNNTSKYATVNATNPVTGTDQRVIHVDPNAVAAGDGTVESPLNRLAEAQAASQANDVIFVHPRADDTQTNLKVITFSLKENQRILGSTTPHLFTATQGTFDLPGYEVGNRPKIDAAIDMFYLADNNEISGFYFDNIDDTPIRSLGSVTNFNINNNYFSQGTGTLTAQVNIANFSGVGVIRDNTFSNVGTSSVIPISVTSVGTAQLTIDGNTINRTALGGNSPITVINNGSLLTLDITNNYISNFVSATGSAINVTSNGDLIANISQNEIYQGVTAAVVDYGIFAELNGASSNLTIDGNTIGTIATAQAVDGGIWIEDNTTGTSNVAITNNTVSDFLTASVYDVGIRYEADGGGTYNLVMTGNDVNHSLSGVVSQGYVVIASGLSTLNLNFQENVSGGTFSSRSAAFFAEDSTLNMRMLNNTLSSVVRFDAENPGGQINFEVFGGQTVPNPLLAGDVFGQNTISGAIEFRRAFGGTINRASPNSLPIPE